MSCAYLFKKHLDNALNNMLQFSVSPEVGRAGELNDLHRLLLTELFYPKH